jgi:hypothetical protein
VVLDDSFDTRSIATITAHIVEMSQIDPSDRPSASILSEKFDQQLQLAHHNVLLRTVTHSVTLAASENHQDDKDDIVGVSRVEGRESRAYDEDDILGVSREERMEYPVGVLREEGEGYRTYDEDDILGLALEEAPSEVAEEYPAEVYSTKVFR